MREYVNYLPSQMYNLIYIEKAQNLKTKQQAMCLKTKTILVSVYVLFMQYQNLNFKM